MNAQNTTSSALSPSEDENSGFSFFRSYWDQLGRRSEEEESASGSEKTPLARDSSVENEDDAAMIQEMFQGFDHQELLEVTEAERDVLGTHITGTPTESPPKDEAFRQQALQGFYDAMACLPIEKRCAYDHAQQTAPKIVQLETPPERFLKFCHYNCWEAADRMAEYWVHRKNVFQERYCFPLALSAKPSAFTDDELDYLHDGPYYILPPENYKRIVMVSDRGRIRDQYDNVPGMRLKIFFYCFHVMSEYALAGTHGMVGLTFFDTAGRKVGKQSKPDNRIMQLIESGAIPVHPRALHFLKNQKPSVAEETVMNIFLLVFRQFKRVTMRLRVHSGDTQTALGTMKEYGFSEVHVPERMGGRMEQVKKVWWQKRLEWERKSYGEDFFVEADKMMTEPAKSSTQKTIQHKMDPQKEQEEWARTVKRTMEEVREHNHYQMEGRKAKRLKREQDQLVNDYRFLEAQLNCSLHAVDRFEQDKQDIRSYLVQVLASGVVPLPGLPEDLLSDPERMATLVFDFMNRIFEYRGRDCATGVPLFQRTTASVTPELEQMLQQIVSGAYHAILLPRSQRVKALADMQQSSLTTNSSNDDDDEVLSDLQNQVVILERHKLVLAYDESFLSSATILALQLEDRFLAYKKRTEEPLAKAIRFIFTAASSGISPSVLTGALRPEAVAASILSQDTSWTPNQTEPDLLNRGRLESILRAKGYLLPDTEKSHDVIEALQKLCHVGKEGTDTISKSTKPQSRKSVGDLEKRRKRVQDRRKKHLKRLWK